MTAKELELIISEAGNVYAIGRTGIDISYVLRLVSFSSIPPKTASFLVMHHR